MLNKHMESISCVSTLNRNQFFRKSGDSTEDLHYQDLKVIEESGLPYQLSDSLKIIDVFPFLSFFLIERERYS